MDTTLLVIRVATFLTFLLCVLFTWWSSYYLENIGFTVTMACMSLGLGYIVFRDARRALYERQK